MMIFFKKMLIFPILVGFFFNHSAYGQSETQLVHTMKNGDEMVQLCMREGAANVLVNFGRDGWDAFGKKVAIGDPDWVEASACLVQGIQFYRGDDAPGDTLGDYGDAILKDAWREVLLKNPKILLELQHKISAQLTCSYPYEASWDFTDELADDYLERGLAVLASVEDKNLQTEREVCALYLQQDHQRIKTLINQKKNHN